MSIRQLAACALTAVFGFVMQDIAYAQAETCEPELVASKYPALADQKIAIGVDPQSPPYVFRDPSNFEELVGMEADLARFVFECAGVEYDFSMGAWSGLLPAVMAGQVDVMWSSLYYLPERAEKLDFIAYMEAGLGALALKGNPEGLKSVNDLCGHVVTTLVGTVEEAVLRRQDGECKESGEAGIDMRLSSDTAASLRQLLNRRADIFLLNLGLTQELAKTHSEEVDFAFTVKSNLKQAAAVPKGREDLVKAIFDGLRLAQEQGLQRELSVKYGVDPELQIPVEVLRE